MPTSPPALVFYAAAVPAVILVGFSKGGLAGLSMIRCRCLTSCQPADPRRCIMLPIPIVQDVVKAWAYRRDIFDRRVVAILLAGFCGIALAAMIRRARVRPCGASVRRRDRRRVRRLFLAAPRAIDRRTRRHCRPGLFWARASASHPSSPMPAGRRSRPMRCRCA